MNNTLIKASAGTGKTFTLATRMIRLLLLNEEPAAIVALTFSRAAAGEIFDKLAQRLACAAASGEAAASESEIVLHNITPALRAAIAQTHRLPLTQGCFTALLRRLIASQHLSMIGTIDSFMFKMVQSFPLELGLQGQTRIMDEFERKRTIHQAVSAVLHRHRSTTEINQFMEAFRLANFGSESRTYFTEMIRFVESWQQLLREFPAEQCWSGDQLLRHAHALRVHADTSSLATRLRTEIAVCWQDDPVRTAKWNLFCDFVLNFDCSLPSNLPAIIKNVLGAWQLGSDYNHITLRNERKLFEFHHAEARLINQTVETILALHLRACVNTTQGIYRVLREFESVYDMETRSQGRITFADIPELITRLDSSIKRNIEYRFDTHFRHWALDEFQDTSKLQWDAIRNLVDEVIQSDDKERSIFVVGDVKQAIYGWRGGDVAIFDHEAESGCYYLDDLNRSYRYSPQIAALINRVFNGDAIAGWLEQSAAGAGNLWQRYWREHTSQEPPGYAEIEYACEPAEDASTIDGYIRRVTELLLDRRPWENNLRCAILVRSNKHGPIFAEALKHAGIPTVWEGENTVNDTPVVNFFLHLLRLAEHPGDRLAWHHILASPPARHLFKDECADTDDFNGAARLSARVLADVARNGVERTLQSYLLKIEDTLDDFSLERINKLIQAAAGFTEHLDENTKLSDLNEYLEQFTNRDIASGSTVRIQTIHRSKGLGFDYVIFPLIETRGITTTGQSDAIVAEDKSWLLKTPSKLLYEAHPALQSARRSIVDKKTFEELCVLYVAMTRAKRALSVIVKRPLKESTSRNKNATSYFGIYAAQSLPHPPPWHDGTLDWQSAAEQERSAPAEVVTAPPFKRARRGGHARITPSTAVIHGLSASELFERSASEAMLKGTRIHEALSRIEWLGPPFDQPDEIEINAVDLTAPSALRDALTRPADLVDLWRERPFEIILNNRWVSGTFDRVVFSGRREICATVMDFKTNRRRNGESRKDFHARLTATYHSQMSLYSQALAKLANLPTNRIRAVLLLTATGECLDLKYTATNLSTSSPR